MTEGSRSADSSHQILLAVDHARRHILWHEVCVRAIGLWWILVAVGVMQVAVQLTTRTILYGWSEIFSSLGIGVISLLLYAVGRGICTLRPWARTAGIGLSIVGLLFIPVGTIIGGGFLWLLVSRMGSHVFSSEYREIVEQTPHIKFRIKVLFAFLMMVAAGILLAAGLIFVVERVNE